MPNPPVDPNAVVLSFEADNSDITKSKIKLKITKIGGDKDDASDVTITDTTTNNFDTFEISGIGKNDNEDDVFRFDMSTFDDDFTITIKSEEANDTIVINDATSYVTNGDGSVTVQYVGDDGQNHTVTVEPGDAQVVVNLATNPDGIVDGTSGDDTMLVAYTDTDGDIIDGADGIDDVIKGYGGNDVIDGGAGDDVIDGGVGDDTIIGGAGADQNIGGSGQDTIDYSGSESGVNVNLTTGQGTGGQAAGDTYSGIDGVQGSDFDDTIVGYDSQSTVPGDSFTNIFDGGAGDDYLDGKGGEDELYGGSGDDEILGGAGDDYIDGGSGNDTIDGGADNDLIGGNTGDDIIDGGAGDDQIYGDGGAAAVHSQSLVSPLVLNPGNMIEETGVNGQAQPGDYAIYNNCGTLPDGTVVQAKLVYVETTEPDLPVDLNYSGDGGVLLNSGSGASSSYKGAEATFRVEFYDQNTGEPISINGSMTFADLDKASNGTESVKLAADDFTSYGTKPDTDLNISETSDELIASGGTNTNTSDQKAWFTANFEGKDSITFTTVARGGGTGYGLKGEHIEDGVVVPITPGNDTIDGGDGDDLIDAGGGDDIVDGGADDDTIALSIGTDQLDGGEGQDTLDATIGTSISDETIQVSVDDAGDGTLQKIGDGTTDTLESIEHYIADEASDEADVITLTEAVSDRSVVSGLEDAVGTFTKTDGTVVNFGGGASQSLQDILDNPLNEGAIQITSGDESGQVGNISFENFETINFQIVPAADGIVHGTAGDDVLNPGYVDAQGDIIDGADGDDDVIHAGAGDDTINAGAGDDEVLGEAGDDRLIVNDLQGNDTFTGGETEEDGAGDAIDMSGENDGLTLDLSAPETGTITDGAGNELGFSEVEEITLGGGDDDVTGSSAADTVNTGAGDDEIDAGAGDDVIDAGDGSDRVDGGAGDDEIDLGADPNAPATPDGKVDTVVFGNGDGNDTIENFEGPTTDPVTGDPVGHDQVDVSGLDDADGNPVNTDDVDVTPDGAGGSVLTFPNGETLTLKGVDPADLDTPAKLHAIGIPMGKDGIVQGTSGDDIIGAGYTDDPHGDRVDNNDAILAGEAPNDDIIQAGAGDDHINAGAGDDEIDGGTGDDSITGGAGDDVIQGGAGDDLIRVDEGFGNDTITGGETDENAGGDVLDASGMTSDLTLDLRANGAADPESGTLTNGTDTASFTEVERVVLGSGDDLVEGSEGDDIVQAGDGDDTMHGGDGNDVLQGEDGDDVLTDGAGDDQLFGGDGNDTLGSARGDNLLSNGSFEDGTHSANNVNGLDNWFNVSGSPDSADDNTGSESWAPFNTSTDGTGYITMWSTKNGPNEAMGQTLAEPLEEGEDYTFTFNAISADRVGNQWFTPVDKPVTFEILDQNGNVLGTTTVNGSDYEQYEINFTAPAGVTGIQLRPNGSPDNSVGYPSVVMDEVDLFKSPEDSSGDDHMDGGDGDDTIYAGEGEDTIIGGDGQDTYDADKGAPEETIHVTVDDEGDGTVAKINDGNTDTVDDVEVFVAGESGDEDDRITLTDVVTDRSTIQGLDDNSVGVFTPDNGGAPISFGGNGEPKLSDILGNPNLTGSVKITDGDESGQVGNISFENFEEINFDIVCFARGTLIATDRGEVAIEDLRAGDMVQTMDHGFQAIRWIGSSTVPARGKLAPVVIRKGTLGAERDLRVSPQHRMLLRGWQVDLLVSEPEALAPAINLVNGDTIFQMDGGEVEYFHMMFDSHEIIFAEGIPSESFHPGEVGMGSFSDETREEIFDLFPELRLSLSSFGPSARITMKHHEAKIWAENSDLLPGVQKH